MRLYHTGYQAIPAPDVHHGRKNADFGQGFYMTQDLEFARRWARERKDADTVLNTYELDTDGLQIHRFQRDEDWYAYIYRNRGGYADRLADMDVIIGPIANDTIYNTYGILTSGFLDAAESLKALQLGPCYEQIVLKTEKAALRLRWIGAEVLDPALIQAQRSAVEAEEKAYQQKLAEVLKLE